MHDEMRGLCPTIGVQVLDQQFTTDGISGGDASFIVLNACFANFISYIISTRTVELASIANHRCVLVVLVLYCVTQLLR